MKPAKETEGTGVDEWTQLRRYMEDAGCGSERGRVAGVLEAVLAVRGEEDVHAHEREEQQPQQHERQHEHDLPALSRAVRHCR